MSGKVTRSNPTTDAIECWDGSAWVPAHLDGVSEEVNTVAAAGATETLTGNVNDITLDEACTFTFPTVVSGKAWGFTLILRQDATGTWATTWPASVDWADATPPELTTTALAVDILEFITVDAGTTWLGFAAGLAIA